MEKRRFIDRLRKITVPICDSEELRDQLNQAMKSAFDQLLTAAKKSDPFNDPVQGAYIDINYESRGSDNDMSLPAVRAEVRAALEAEGFNVRYSGNHLLFVDWC